MRLIWRCGCGDINFNREDWLCHFRHRGFWRGMRHLLMTRIELHK